jgi:hypothetical protein
MDRAPAERSSEAIVLALHPEPELDKINELDEQREAARYDRSVMLAWQLHQRGRTADGHFGLHCLEGSDKSTTWFIISAGVDVNFVRCMLKFHNHSRLR